MYKIFDKNKKLIAIVNKFKKELNSKNFLTDEEMSMQFATFNLKKGDEIKRHIHNKQKRVIFTTTEAITVLEGSMFIDLYDNNHEFLEKVLLEKHDSIVIYDGGHGLQMNEDCHFLEFKQGPYDSKNDKYHF